MKICLSCEGVTNTPAQRCGHCDAWLLPTDTVHYPVRRGEQDAGNPLLGTIIDGKYRLQSVLGRGGFGTVFRAQHIGSLATVALKLLHPRLHERPEYRRALVPEARRAAAVTNDHCARLLDVGDGDATAYLAMELVEGRTLDLLVRDGPLAPSLAVDVLLQVADALVAIHAQGLVHCDLSARNVMVGVRDGTLRVKVLDFGIARSVTLAGSTHASAGLGGEFRGFVNPAFSAPELLAGGEVGPRADLYSFGSIAWLLLTGALPVDDTDARRTAAAVQAGHLRRWPGPGGVPRRLQRLIQACLQQEASARPASAAAVGRELLAIRGRRRRPLVPTAIAALAVAIVVTISTTAAPPPFLRPLPGSQLLLREGQFDALVAPQYLHPDELATLGFVHGGFAPHRLHAVLARQGRVELRQELAPEFDAATDSLLLSTLQHRWREVVDGLLRASQSGPVDLSFVVPGTAPLGTARLRLDDKPPQIKAALRAGPHGIRRDSELFVALEDEVGVAAATVSVQFDGGQRFQLALPPSGAEFALGEELAKVIGRVEALGPGHLLVKAHDRAGNHATSVPLEFSAVDVGVPGVVLVTGPAGESFVPTVDRGGGQLQARLSVQLSSSEANCTLQIVGGTDRTPPLPLAGTGPVHACEVTLPGDFAAAGPLRFLVTDAVGNQSAVDRVVELRDRTMAPRWDWEAGARWTGAELVLAPAGAVVVASFGPSWTLVEARLQPADAGAGREVVVSQGPLTTSWRLPFPRLEPGRHLLRLSLQEGAGGNGLEVQHEVAVQVLPERIEVRLPAVRTRFLPALLEAAVLAKSGTGSRLVAGGGWRFDPALRPFLRGKLHVQGVAVPLPLPDALLPEVEPVAGRNLLAVEIVDLLDRPVALLRGDELAGVEPVAPGPREIADFWWHPGGAEPIGEEIAVEYEQPALVQLRSPLPFRDSELAEVRLGLLQTEIPAIRVEPQFDGGTTITFVVPYPLWSVAAQLGELSRDEYGRRERHALPGQLVTPDGRQKITLQLRTERSTLVPIELAHLTATPLPPGLAGLRLLPVLAPSAPFAEPVPAVQAPPRQAYRPQVATSVQRMQDFLLQDREFEVGAARELVQLAAPVLTKSLRRRCVHAADPLGAARLEPRHLLPDSAAAAPSTAALVGVDFYQAYALTRLLGVLVLDDADAFRLPLGCELELAAFGPAPPRACNGPAAHGGAVSMAAFRASPTGPGGAAAALAAGDVVDNPAGGRFYGLDFGVREWVFDLPHVRHGELLLREWIGDHQTHLGRVQAIALGSAEPEPHPVGPMRKFGVVRGLAFGERDGLIGYRGELLDPAGLATVPASVPGVLRSEQLQRDGRHLLSGGREPRLQQVGFRVVGSASTVARLRGRR